MKKQIEHITIFADTAINMQTGREYFEHASIQVRDDKFNIIRSVRLTSVVSTEREFWGHVERTIEELIDEGHEVDEPEVNVYRTHKTFLKLDYFEAIGRHI